jgi:hypothetical protein
MYAPGLAAINHDYRALQRDALPPKDKVRSTYIIIRGNKGHDVRKFQL